MYKPKDHGDVRVWENEWGATAQQLGKRWASPYPGGSNTQAFLLHAVTVGALDLYTVHSPAPQPQPVTRVELEKWREQWSSQLLNMFPVSPVYPMEQFLIEATEIGALILNLAAS